MNKFSKYHFAGQKSDEEILLVIHRHWFNILSQFLIIFLMIGLLAGSYLAFPLLYPDIKSSPAENLFAFLENLFFLLTWITFFVIWIDYYFDVWIVTSKRIVNIEQKGLFSRTTSELELEKIQDITTDVHGVIPTFLNYGDLQVQTAAEQEKFLFKSVPDPYYIKDAVMNLRKKAESRDEEEFGELLRKKVHDETV